MQSTVGFFKNYFLKEQHFKLFVGIKKIEKSRIGPIQLFCDLSLYFDIPIWENQLSEIGKKKFGD